MDNYDKYYSGMLEAALRFQDFVTELLYAEGVPLVAFSSKQKQLSGENKAGIEIKLDQLMDKTGNIYIETSEKSNPKKQQYTPSGIYRDDNTWLYAIGNYSTVYIIPKKYLKMLDGKYRTTKTPTSTGFLMPLADAEKYSIKILREKTGE